MGKRDETGEEVPVVHPIISFSEDHFKKNFTKRSYRNPRKYFSENAMKVEFADIVGLVEVLVTRYFDNSVIDKVIGNTTF